MKFIYASPYYGQAQLGSDTMIGSLDHFQTETLVPRLRSTYEFPILSVPKQFLAGYPVVAQDSTGRVGVQPGKWFVISHVLSESQMSQFDRVKSIGVTEQSAQPWSAYPIPKSRQATRYPVDVHQTALQHYNLKTEILNNS